MRYQAAYSVEDLQSVVSHAAALGVRVMPEFDVPGHGSWGYGMPELMVQDGPCSDTLDPTNPDVYTFLSSFLTEMTGYFPDAYLFLGGDEVQTKCFTQSPSVSAWMAANNISDGVELQSYFWQQVTKQVSARCDATLLCACGVENGSDSV